MVLALDLVSDRAAIKDQLDHALIDRVSPTPQASSSNAAASRVPTPQPTSSKTRIEYTAFDDDVPLPPVVSRSVPSPPPLLDSDMELEPLASILGLGAPRKLTSSASVPVINKGKGVDRKANTKPCHASVPFDIDLSMSPPATPAHIPHGTVIDLDDELCSSATSQVPPCIVIDIDDDDSDNLVSTSLAAASIKDKNVPLRTPLPIAIDDAGDLADASGSSKRPLTSPSTSMASIHATSSGATSDLQPAGARSHPRKKAHVAPTGKGKGRRQESSEDGSGDDDDDDDDDKGSEDEEGVNKRAVPLRGVATVPGTQWPRDFLCCDVVDVMTEVMEKTKGKDAKGVVFAERTGLKYSATTMKRVYTRWFAASPDVRQGYEGNLGPNTLFFFFFLKSIFIYRGTTAVRSLATHK
jgi:hypothetical protein